MLHKLRNRAADQKGFTLIELLVVILIIGILAAIALPTFLGQQAKGQDSSAKSDARNAVSQMESCYTDKQDYLGCTVPGVAVVVSTPSTAGYSVEATSASTNKFKITKASGGYSRTCTAAGNAGCGNATSDTSW